jgi:hypothetical protein
MRATRSFRNRFGTRLAGLAFASFQAFGVLVLSSGAAFAQAPATGGDTIAFHRDGEIWLMNADGTGQRALQEGHQPAWSPDGTRLASNCSIGDYSGAICLIDVRNGYTIGLTERELNAWPTFSPNGKKIAYSNGLDIWGMDAEDGANKTQLTFVGDPWTTWATAASYSPDGSRIAFAVNEGHVYVMNADGSGVPQLVARSGTGYPWTDSIPPPAWSPDGTRLSFIVWNALTDNFEIRYSAIHTDGTFSAPSWLAGSGFVDGHSWSPDGNKLAYGEDGQIIVKNLTTGHIDVIASGYQPAWEPAAAPADPDGTTPAGANVTVDLGAVTVTFSNVTSPGTTTAVPAVWYLSQHLPGYFTVAGRFVEFFSNHIDFMIRTTATYEGPVTLTFDVPGDPTASDFTRIHVRHYENGQLIDRTVRAPEQPAPDFAALQISARVSRL